MDALTAGQQVQMTHDSYHSEQAETNAWNVDRHSLRLLSDIVGMVDDMDGIAPTIRVPLLVLHGGRDFFTAPEDVRAFCAVVPRRTPQRLAYFPESYHLLMYDAQREQVFRAVEDWVERGGR